MRFRDRWKNVNNCVYTGTVFDGNTKMEPSSYFLDKFIAKEDCADYLNRANGFWGAVVTDGCSKGWMAADRIRSYPLFYAQKDGILYISDDAYWIREECQLEEIDKDAEQELLMTEQVTGSDTLFRGIKQVQAGEFVKFYYEEYSQRWKIEAAHYYRYLLKEQCNLTREACLSFHDEAMTVTFKRLIDYANGRTIVIPLSGGYDSRLILLTLKKLGYDNLLAFSYGAKGNEEAIISKEVAEQLGVKWLFSEYTHEKIKPMFDSKERKEYDSFASNFVSLPHTQDWWAIKDLKSKNMLPRDSIFVPGHSSEVPAGSHSSEYPILYSDNATLFDAINALENKIYKLSELCNNTRIKSKSIERLLLSAGNLNQYRNPVSLFDSIDIAERQAKFIVNSIRVYEYFGYNWWLPYYDVDFLNCWAHIPLLFHYNRNLYYEYIVQQSKILNLYPGNEMKRNINTKRKYFNNKLKEIILHSCIPKSFLRFLKIKFGHNMTLDLKYLSDEDYLYAMNMGANNSNGVCAVLYIREVRKSLEANNV